ncbi:MAG TPA: 23S rRNA (guanosine(2251)-2'-O)-methyltransferase RlmB [Acidimicrobiia bacterium]
MSGRRPDGGRPRPERRGAAAPDDGASPGGQVEGRRAVRELLVAGRRRVRTLWLATGGDALDELAALADITGAEVRWVAPARVAELARTDSPQGVVAFADPLQFGDIDALLADPEAFLVGVDGVTDPQNLGAVMRTAELAGATGMVVPRHRSARLTPTVAKAAAGALEYLPVVSVAGIPAVLDRAARAGVWTVGLDGTGDTSLFDLNVADRALMLVLGAEGRGISRLARERCDVLAAIPMFGSLTSLNVSAAAAVACFEVARRRRG